MASKGATILRVKRKAGEEPVDGLLLAVKRSKCEHSEQIYFKLAGTVNSQEESLTDHLKSVISEAKVSNFTKWGNLRRRDSVDSLKQKMKLEQKAESDKKRLDLLNNRRLVFTETLTYEEVEKQGIESEDSEVLKLFQLYDVVEDDHQTKTEEVKIESESTITCNGIPLIHTKGDVFMYDVYITDCPTDFANSTVSLHPCARTEDLVCSDASEDEEAYEDEDDSNDEGNWRNDYPDEDEDFGRDVDYYNDEDYDEDKVKLSRAFENFDLDEEREDDYASYKARIMKELKDDCSSGNELDSD